MASTSASSSLDTRRTTALLSTPPSLLSQFSSPLPTRSYSRQYAALYDFRLRKLRRGRLLQKAKERWEGGGSAAAGGVAKGKEEKKTAAGIRHTARILDVKKGQVTYVSGIVYVEMRLKPDVLADLSREAYLPPLPPVTSYSDPTTDSIYLEDESGRLKLVGPLLTDPAQRGLFVTGTVGAFLGTERENGEFHVQDVCWPGLPLRSEKTGGLSKGSEIKMEEDEQEDREDDEYVVLTSGLDLGGGEGEMGFAAAEMRLSLLAEWIGGEIGDEEHRRKSSRIAGLIIAGNLMTTAQSASSLSSSATDSTTPSTDAPVASTSKSSSSSSSAKLSKQASSQANANLTPSPAEVLLAHLVPLSASLPIVLMPGATDPASAALPQQAVHRAVLRGAGKWAGSSSSSSSKGSGEGGSGSSKTNGDAKSAPSKRSASGDAEDDAAAGEEAAGGIHLYNNPSWIQFNSSASASSSSSTGSSNRQNRTRILASSGQNLDDVLKYMPSASKAKEAAAVAASASQEADAEASGSGSGSKKEEEDVEMGSPDGEEEEEEDERLRAACRLLEYGHIAPTAPDTLWCFPFTDRDPFLLSSPSQIPDVFLIGNQPHFATTLWRQEDERSESAGEREGKGVGVQVVLVPSFAKTGEVGLLNLRTRVVRRGRVGWEM